MGRLTNRISVAIVRTKLNEEQILGAIHAAEGNAPVDESDVSSGGVRRKRRYTTREMRSDQIEQTVMGSDGND
jgi:hypothetical protein